LDIIAAPRKALNGIFFTQLKIYEYNTYENRNMWNRLFLDYLMNKKDEAWI
jgi:hypothetical protein